METKPAMNPRPVTLALIVLAGLMFVGTLCRACYGLAKAEKVIERIEQQLNQK